MEPFRFHVFVCDQQKPEGVPCCAVRGSAQVLEALRREINARGLEDEVQITACGSLGLCEHGPNLVVYPEGIWYSGVTAADVPEIVRSHFQEDTPVERLTRANPADLRAEILSNREKMFAARRAQEAAGVLPDNLNERIRAFQESRVILTALELDLFTAVGDGAGAAEVAATLRNRSACHRDASECAGVPAPACQAGRGLSQLAGGRAVLRRRIARQHQAGLAA